jgi:chromosome segregation ATPase
MTTDDPLHIENDAERAARLAQEILTLNHTLQERETLLKIAVSVAEESAKRARREADAERLRAETLVGRLTLADEALSDAKRDILKLQAIEQQLCTRLAQQSAVIAQVQTDLAACTEQCLEAERQRASLAGSMAIGGTTHHEEMRQMEEALTLARSEKSTLEGRLYIGREERMKMMQEIRALKQALLFPPAADLTVAQVELKKALTELADRLTVIPVEKETADPVEA